MGHPDPESVGQLQSAKSDVILLTWLRPDWKWKTYKTKRFRILRNGM
jgi:hypothetical protein